MKSLDPLGSPTSVRVNSDRSYVAREVLLPAQEFVRTEAGSSVLLLSAAIGALLWANSSWAASYFHLWQTSITIDLDLLIVSKSLAHWVNAASITISFFVVALKVKRELIHGHLFDPRRVGLAYRDSQVISDTKTGILCASLLSGILGYVFLLITTRSQAILKPGE